MRILHAAKKLEERIETCSNCHSILAVAEDDLHFRNEVWEYVCPVCEKRNDYGSLILDQLFPWKREENEDEEISSDNSMRLNKV